MIFWSRFCPHIKGRFPWNEVAKQKVFMSEQANFSASDQLGRNSPTVQNGPEKRKNRLIKLVSKWKRASRKGDTSFLFFYFWDLKLVPIDLALNFASGNLTWDFIKCRNGTKKTSQIWISGVFRAAKLENIWTKFFLQEVDQKSCGWNSICQIWILPLWILTLPCFLVKISQIMQKVIVFFLERGEEIKTLFWHSWIAQ